MKKAILILVVVLLASMAWAADVSFSGETSFSSSISVPPVDDAWKFTKADVKQRFELDAYGDDTSFHLDAGFGYDALENTLNPVLTEVYADFFLGKAAFRFGRQKATWGDAEILSAVDVINPSDLTNPIEGEKLAIDALKVSYDAFPFAFDLYWIPLFTPSKIPPVLIPIIKPETKLENSEVGAKASAYTSVGDFALYGYYGWEDVPSVHGEYPALHGEYDRLVMLGASAAVPVGEVTLKAEAGWYPKRDKVVAASAGVEWMKDDFTLIGEIYGDWDKNEEKLSSQVGASFGYDLLDGDLELSVSGIVELGDFDGAVMAGVDYSFTDELKASAQVVYLFEGPDAPGTYGSCKNLDCVKLKAVYSY
jgi:hypothetical protein